MNDELDIYSNQDAVTGANAFFIDNKKVTLDDALKAVDDILKSTDEEKVAFIRSMLGMHKVSGIALAKFLHEWDKDWDTDAHGQPFVDFIYNEVGLGRTTVVRYCNVWEMYSGKYVPDKFEPKILARPVKDQIVISAAIAQGHEFNDTEWANLSNAVTNAEVRAIVQKAKSQPPRKSSLVIYLERDGSLTVWTGEGVRKHIGNLDLDEEAIDPIVKKAIHRIVSSSGIVRK
jgi:hypothetical protein